MPRAFPLETNQELMRSSFSVSKGNSTVNADHKNDEYAVFSDLGDLLIETSSHESLSVFFLKENSPLKLGCSLLWILRSTETIVKVKRFFPSQITVCFSHNHLLLMSTVCLSCITVFQYEF